MTDHRLGGMRMAKETSAVKTEAELADYYNETEDLSEFAEENAVPVT